MCYIVYIYENWVAWKVYIKLLSVCFKLFLSINRSNSKNAWFFIIQIIIWILISSALVLKLKSTRFLHLLFNYQFRDRIKIAWSAKLGDGQYLVTEEVEKLSNKFWTFLIKVNVRFCVVWISACLQRKDTNCKKFLIMRLKSFE